MCLRHTYSVLVFMFLGAATRKGFNQRQRSRDYAREPVSLTYRECYISTTVSRLGSTGDALLGGHDVRQANSRGGETETPRLAKSA